MNFKGHLIGGIVCFLAITFFYFYMNLVSVNIYHIPLYAVVFIYASLMSDLDTKSIVQKFTYTILFVILVALFIQHDYVYASLVGIVAVVPLIFKHRGIMHNILTGLIISLALGALIGFDYSPFFMMGFIVHQMLDYKIFKKL